MSLIGELNTVSAVKKTVSLSKLDPNTRYQMKDLRSVTTRHGRSIATTLIDVKNGEQIDVFLPRRVSAFLKEDSIQDINSGPPMYLVYLGQIGQCYNIRFEH